MAGPLVLAFDTSAAHCAAALLNGDRVLGLRDEPMLKGQAERLIPMLEELLAEAGVRWRDLSALAVGVGPGNFTGVRIAVAAARGLSLSLGIPAHGVSTFEAAALGLPRPLLCLLDARAGRLFGQLFTDDTSGAPFLADSPEALRARLPFPECPLTGEADLMTGALPHALSITLSGPRLAPAFPLPVAMARIAALRDPATAARPAPLYLRPADAAPAADPPPRILAEGTGP